MYSDKRKFKRIDFDCEILYPTILIDDKKKTLMDENFHLHTLDISEAGICLQSNFPILKDTFISFYFRIENNIPFKCLIKIIWDTHEDDVFLSGGEFISLTQDDIDLLRHYVNQES